MYKIENKEELMMLSGAGVGQGRDQSHELGLSMSRLMIMAGRCGGEQGREERVESLFQYSRLWLNIQAKLVLSHHCEVVYTRGSILKASLKRNWSGL